MSNQLYHRQENDLLALIYERYYKLMIFIAEKYLFNKIYAEDVAHECMLRIINCINFLDMSKDDSVKRFVCVVTKNIAIDYNKHMYASKKAEIFELSSEQQVEDPIITVIIEDAYQRLLCCINRLDAKYKDVCYLKYVCDFKEREIALTLGITVNTVGTRIRRAKSILRRMLKDSD